MDNFKKIDINDFVKIDPILKKYNVENCDHCFFTMLIWSFRHHVEYTICQDTLFMRTKGDNSYWYLSPVGQLPFEKAVQLIIADAVANSIVIRLHVYLAVKDEKLKKSVTGARGHTHNQILRTVEIDVRLFDERLIFQRSKVDHLTVIRTVGVNPFSCAGLSYNLRLRGKYHAQKQ